MAGFAGAKPDADASFKDWEKEIAAYIKNNKIEKPVIIGHSMGGGLAMAIAADYPELVGKIVIVILYLVWQQFPTLILHPEKITTVHQSLINLQQ